MFHVITSWERSKWTLKIWDRKYRTKKFGSSGTDDLKFEGPNIKYWKMRD